jgi:hypothetical protein
MACIAIGAIVIFMSTRLPYFSSLPSRIFFELILPLLLLSVGVVLCARKRGHENAFRQAYNGENPAFGKGRLAVVGLIVALVVISFLFPMIFMPVTAGPSILFARNKFEAVGVAKHSLPYSTLYRGFNNLSFALRDSTTDISFLWPTGKSSDIHPGDCMLITGRSWFFGTYVENVQAVSCQ